MTSFNLPPVVPAGMTESKDCPVRAVYRHIRINPTDSQPLKADIFKIQNRQMINKNDMKTASKFDFGKFNDLSTYSRNYQRISITESPAVNSSRNSGTIFENAASNSTFRQFGS